MKGAGVKEGEDGGEEDGKREDGGGGNDEGERIVGERFRRGKLGNQKVKISKLVGIGINSRNILQEIG